MDDEIKDLKLEIRVLNKRIEILEAKERRRSAFKRVKIIFDILLLALLAYGVWYSYDYITNYIPNKIDDTIKDILLKAIKIVVTDFIILKVISLTSFE